MEDTFTKTKKQFFYVMGYAQTGSGSLTYPEDFDEVGLFETREDAQKWCDEKNKKTVEEEGIDCDDLEDPDEVEDALNDASDAYCYYVTPLHVLKLK